jgi:broad specificity phosphatase PhoE
MSSPERAPISEAAAPVPSPVPSPAPAPDTKETPRPLPSRVLLVRHGESTWNAEKRVQGQHDPPLSELGRRQAGRLAARLAGRPLVALYSSDLRRAWQTAEPIAEAVGLEPTPLRGLREIALGDWEGKTREELASEFPEPWEAWSQRPSWDLVPSGEGAGPFERRVRETLAWILSQHTVGDILCVTHGGVIQVALGSVVAPRRGSDGLFPFVIENCSLTVLQRSSSRTVVTAVNDTCHLS